MNTMGRRDYPPEVIEEASRWPLSVAEMWSIWRQFPDEDLRQMVIEAEVHGIWPVRYFAAMEQRDRDQRRFEAAFGISNAAVAPQTRSWGDTLPRRRSKYPR